MAYVSGMQAIELCPCFPLAKKGFRWVDKKPKITYKATACYDPELLPPWRYDPVLSEM